MNTRKSKIVPILPSRVTVEGLDRAPHRAFLRGLGLSDRDIGRPFVGVASTDGRVTPCNALLGVLAKDACTGVRDAGGVPFDFASIAVADSMFRAKSSPMASRPWRAAMPTTRWSPSPAATKPCPA
jgi:dihydroxyacid dehydratase/phosphogluconate dehydratase